MVMLLVIFKNQCLKHFLSVNGDCPSSKLTSGFLLSLFGELLDFHGVLVQKNVRLTRIRCR